MNSFVIARQPHYDVGPEGNRLNGFGVDQFERLGEKLGELLKEERIKLFCSLEKSALQSASVLGEKLGVEPEGHDIFSDSKWSMDYMRYACNIFKQCEPKYTSVVLVTHLRWSEELPSHLGGHFFQYYDDKHILSSGDAVLVDCRKRAIQPITY